MTKSLKLVYGLGVNDLKYRSVKDRKVSREYETWRCMLKRCTKETWIKRPTYIGSSCSDNFKNFSYFYEWCNKQKGFCVLDANNRVWQLDKDILIRGNKVYSEDTCIFLPHRVNSLLTSCDASRGELPIGVHLCLKTGKFISRCNKVNTRVNLGVYDAPMEAFLAYKTFKESLIKEVANEYKEQLDSRAYAALMAYQVTENN